MAYEEIEPMGVGNMAFILERMGADCGPNQQIRELTVNAIEAIRHNGSSSGHILWMLDPIQKEEVGLNKLCIVDDGCGMVKDGPNGMARLLNNLAASGGEKIQAIDSNFGIGGKISAAVQNPIGVVYHSWVGRVGHRCTLKKAKTIKGGEEYGLDREEIAEGQFSRCVAVPDSMIKMFPIIAESGHGTVVTLLGKEYSQDTASAPDDATVKFSWVTKALNSRFFKIPPGIEIKALDKEDNLRQVLGAKACLDRITSPSNGVSYSGYVELESAIAYWWICDEERGKDKRFSIGSGHTAAIYKDELYEIKTGSAGQSMLKKFGIPISFRRFVIYVEPMMVGLMTDTARSRIFLGEKDDLPWEDWGEEFREKMPEAMKAFIQSEYKKCPVSDPSDDLKKLLRENQHLFAIELYKPNPIGEEKSTDPEIGEGGPHEIIDREGTDNTRTGRRHGGSKKGSIYSKFKKIDDGVSAKKIIESPNIQVQWVSEEKISEDAIGRMASFDISNQIVQANLDFSLYLHFLNRWMGRYESTSDHVRATIIQKVKARFEQALVETIQGAIGYRGSRYWSDQDFDKLTSPEALTAAVMQRISAEKDIEKQLVKELGPPLQTKAEPMVFQPPKIGEQI